MHPKIQEKLKYAKVLNTTTKIFFLKIKLKPSTILKVMAQVRQKIESEPMIPCQQIFDAQFLAAKENIPDQVYHDFQVYEPIYANRRKTFYKIRCIFFIERGGSISTVI